MIDWAEEMIKDMKKNGEIKDDEGGEETTLKLNKKDLNAIASIVITQLNSDNDESENEESENEDNESEH